MELVLLADLEGTLAPCGCSSHQRGGLHHLAALLATRQRAAPNRLLLGAGPLLFATGNLGCEAADQKRLRAELVAHAMAELRLFAWAPGYEDWADGEQRLSQLAGQTGAQLLAAGLASSHAEPAPFEGGKLVTVGSVLIGVVGVSAPRTVGGRLPEGVERVGAERLVAAVTTEIAALRGAGARLIVGLGAIGHDAAMSLAQRVTDLDVLLVGSPHSRGPAALAGRAPALVGSTLLVQPPNHGQAVVTLEVFLDPAAPAAGRRPALQRAMKAEVERASRIFDLDRQIHQLQVWLQHAELNPRIAEPVRSARQRALEQLQTERTATATPPAPPAADGLRYRLHAIDPALGVEPTVGRLLEQYTAAIAERNGKAVAGLGQPSAAAQDVTFVGAARCASCHQLEHARWRQTAHARAYESLVRDHRELDLECVGCHVTGYQQPGGATVVGNQHLRGVQCEQCHGPGGRHVARPLQPGLTIRRREGRWCVDSCHHPPHVEGFDPEAMLPLVLGGGHDAEAAPVTK